jgi:cytochrome c-type biogenesis protein CcmF
MILLGELSLWVALLMAAWGTAVGFAGGMTRRADLVASAERAVYATFGFTLLASLGMWAALLSSDFSIRYVASYTSANLPVMYKITALWAGQSGSLLFWSLILAFYAAAAVFVNRNRTRDLMPYVMGTLSAVSLFFLAMVCIGTNPYERLDFLPPDGRGMNPQLQNPGMAFHPPNLYLGYVATTVPFAFAIAALITRRLDGEWLLAVRRWALVTWLFLTVGIVLGMWWAYVTLGWGGYWAWDPVENASLLPWLTVTAFLHSIMVQEKRQMLRKWNVTLVVATFLLSILGTFITRSGVISSVHSFAQSAVGYWFLGFLVLAMAVTIYLVTTRLSDLEAKAQLESMVSREASFLLNNLVLVAVAFSVLWGTLFPILSELVRGTKVTVGPPFFNQVNVPFGLLLLALTGIGPLIAWRRASVANLRRQFTGPVVIGVVVATLLVALGMRDLYALMAFGLGAFVLGTVVQEFQKGVSARHRMYSEGYGRALFRLVARNRRRYGGYIVHVGIVVLFAGFAGAAFGTDHDFELRTGESFHATDPYGRQWEFVSEGISEYETLNRRVMASSLAAYRDGQRAGFLRSEKRQYVDSRGNPLFEPNTEPAIMYSVRQDLYVVFAGADGDLGHFRLNINPLVMLVWAGGLIMLVGGLIVMWPQAQRQRSQAGYTSRLEPHRDTVGSAS